MSKSQTSLSVVVCDSWGRANAHKNNSVFEATQKYWAVTNTTR